MAHYPTTVRWATQWSTSRQWAFGVSQRHFGQTASGILRLRHTYAIGEAGQRYTITVNNSSGMRVEAVASVDGLDVDGKTADFAKRGYPFSLGQRRSTAFDRRATTKLLSASARPRPSRLAPAPTATWVSSGWPLAPAPPRGPDPK
jgi:hypothetical protein